MAGETGVRHPHETERKKKLKREKRKQENARKKERKRRDDGKESGSGWHWAGCELLSYGLELLDGANAVRVETRFIKRD